MILVDRSDLVVGRMEKMEAHRKGILHRAFSVFIFNSKGQMLLQQRALGKYHSAGLWTNSCCSHPRPGETTESAAMRRLDEEMRLKTPLSYKTAFVYHAEFENGLIEHEYDHVYTGLCEIDPLPNPEEVAAFKWLYAEEIKDEIKANPEQFTAWFKIAMEQLF